MLEPVEIIELIEKIKLRIQYDHELQYIAFLNALGKSNSKDYKYYGRKCLFWRRGYEKETQPFVPPWPEYLLCGPDGLCSCRSAAGAVHPCYR